MSGLRYFPLKIGNTENLCYSNFVKGLLHSILCCTHVPYTQVAVNGQTGASRGFAFVDFMTAEEAERAQEVHNGSVLEGSHIRVAFGTPGRSGSSILGIQQNTYNMVCCQLNVHYMQL